MQLRCRHDRLQCSRSSSRLIRRRPLDVCSALKAKSGKQVCCSKTLVAKQDHVKEVESLCLDIANSSQQMLKDKVNGILSYDFVKDGFEPNHFHFWERYESNVHLGRHNTSPAVQRFMEKVVPLLERPIGMALYEYNDGKISNVCMQGGPKGEGGLDDATGASGAAGGASMKQSSATVDLTKIEEDHEEVFFLDKMTKQLDSMKDAFSNIFGGGKK